MLKKISIRTKLLIVLGITTVSLVIAIGVSMSFMRERMVQDRVAKLRGVVEVATEIATVLDKDVAAGKFSREEGVARFKEIVRGMWYDNHHDYVSVGNTDGVWVVNPGAPKGGVARMISIGTFDNFNVAVSGVKGNLAPAVTMIYETLMARSQDEVATEYGLLAESASHPDDFSWVIYRLRKEARWHDGSPVTADDVIFSLETLKKQSPFYASYYRHVAKTEKVGERDVKFTFDSPGNRELPSIVGELVVLPKLWWEGTDGQGRKRDVSATMLEKPMGSAPYRIKQFEAGRSVVLERVKDYWGANVPCQIGQNNFDELHFEFFRDNLVALEAFKADQADWIAENSAKQWATAYDFPAVAEKRVVKEEFPINDSGRMQAFAFNIRRERFKDVRLRRAFNYAFDFEEMNKQLFYGQYKRINSYFDGTELASSGLPQGRSCRSWRRCATRCHQRSSPRPIPIPSEAIPKPCAQTCAMR